MPIETSSSITRRERKMWGTGKTGDYALIVTWGGGKGKDKKDGKGKWKSKDKEQPSGSYPGAHLGKGPYADTGKRGYSNDGKGKSGFKGKLSIKNQLTNPALALPPPPLNPDGSTNYKEMLCHAHLEGRRTHAADPSKCKYAYRDPTFEDYKRYSVSLRIQCNNLFLGKGGVPPKTPFKAGGKGKGESAMPVEAADAPAFKLCAHYAKGTCSVGDQCTNIHQNEDGKCFKTAAPASVRRRARSASIRAYRAQQRQAAQLK